jgi:phage shock protein PspC (stress-responsive transcriptional regulator)
MEGKKLARSKNAMIFGVCAGLAEYAGIGVTAMRFMWVVFTILTALGLAFAAYVVLAIIMAPPEGAPQSDRFWHHMGGRNVMILFSLVLICIGCYIIVQSILGWDLWKYVFPVGLIVIGGLLFAFAFGGHKKQ